MTQIKNTYLRAFIKGFKETFRSGWVKIILSFVIMGMAFFTNNPFAGALQFSCGVVYFCVGLALVLDAKKT